MSQSKPLQPWRNRPNPYQGTPGPQGPPGEDGAEWHSVSGAPAGSLGVVGDWALDAATGQVWEKTGSATWTSRGSLRGPQGVQGETGPKGDQGDTGPAGTAATVSVGSTTTGAPGTDASVTQSGTPQARTFNFTIPRGATGAKGDKGDPGGAGVLGGGKGTHATAQSIPNATWTVVTRSGSSSAQSWFYIGDGGVTVFAGGEMHCRVDSAGWWMVGASLSWASGATNRRVMAVETWTGTDPGVSNGTRIIVDENNPVANPNRPTHNANTVINLEANTNVRLFAWQNSGGSLSTDPDWGPTELWLTRIL